MQEFQYRAIFYDRPDGTEPANEFLMSLDKKMRAKMALDDQYPASRRPRVKRALFKAFV